MSKEVNQDNWIREFTKLPKFFRDKYLELAAELAVAQGLYGGQKMPVVVQDIGFYSEPIAGGYVGWIKTIDGSYFIDVDGKITKPSM